MKTQILIGDRTMESLLDTFVDEIYNGTTPRYWSLRHIAAWVASYDNKSIHDFTMQEDDMYKLIQDYLESQHGIARKAYVEGFGYRKQKQKAQ
jgi:hypothetical protein